MKFPGLLRAVDSTSSHLILNLIEQQLERVGVARALALIIDALALHEWVDMLYHVQHEVFIVEAHILVVLLD